MTMLRFVAWSTTGLCLLACGGKDGSDGASGADGNNGTDGVSALMNVTNEQAGKNCPNGGVRVDCGADKNADGKLDKSEISGTQYVCGVIGDTGDKGDTGATGAKGDTGATGDKGDTGATGAKGDTGATGDKGDTGATGAKGDTGATGDKGDTGATGAKGDTGATGDKGDTGATGAKGDTGATGDKGDTGATGDKGDTGATGDKGDTGATGDKGDTGATGAKGDTGATGDKGDTGATGDKGDTGATGAKGDTGATGATGYNSVISVGLDEVNSACASGYSKTISVGIDDGTPTGTARNGTLESGEIDSSYSACTICPTGYSRNAAHQCAPDSDGDGTVDSEDACPSNPALTAQNPCGGGCTTPPDSDGDGLVDCLDFDASLVVTNSMNNGNAGNMFDIVPLSNMQLKTMRFTFNGCDASSELARVYYKTGTYRGAETNSAAWTPITSANVPCDAYAAAFNAEISLGDISLTANTKYALYIDGGTRGLCALWKGEIGALVASNSALQVYEGSGVSDLFGSGYLNSAVVPMVQITYNTK